MFLLTLSGIFLNTFIPFYNYDICMDKINNFGINEETGETIKIFHDFRIVAKNYTKIFKDKKNNIAMLLGSKQNQTSGIFREGIIKDFLREILPHGLSIDSGFIYGFEFVKTSKQLDIIIWDSFKHSAIFKSKDFVIVPPDSVISVISVKSNFNNRDIKSGITNLLSVSELELEYLDIEKDNTKNNFFLPIHKVFLTLGSRKNYEQVTTYISEFFKNQFTINSYFREKISISLKNISRLPDREKQEDKKFRYNINRIFPKCYVSLGKYQKSFVQELGPPLAIIKGQEIIPYLFPQNDKLTSPLEKFIFYLLRHIYEYLETKERTMLSMWGDFHPKYASRSGDAFEEEEEKGLPLV
jgi:hypothetical protein